MSLLISNKTRTSNLNAYQVSDADYLQDIEAEDAILPLGTLLFSAVPGNTYVAVGEGKKLSESTKISGGGGTPLSPGQVEAIDGLVSPEEDYEDLTEVTAAIKAIVDALQA